MNPDAAKASAGIDLTQFYQVFFEEAGENLEQMEKLLLALDITAADDETLNAIFRCAHSIKGGAATFGFDDVAELTHQMETLLDKLRRRELAPSSAMVDALLQSGDALRAQLARHQGAAGEAVDTEVLLRDIRALASGPGQAPAAPAAAHAEEPLPAAAPAAPGGALARQIELTIGPLERPGDADNLAELFREISDLGTIEPIDGGLAADGMRRFKIVTTSRDDELLDLFTFHVARESIAIAPLGMGYGFHEGAPGAPAAVAPDPGYGFFEPLAPIAGQAAAHRPAAPIARPRSAAPAAGAERAPGAGLESSTLRVAVEKVDQLINLVGELVITQAMLAQNGAALDPALHQQFSASLANLERNTRDLQESVMSIRMIPMSVVFSRFPRMLRDLAAKLGKKLEFVTHGEATELDKGMVEKLTDPLTHLVRNACDHGIELPAERAAAGKAEHGTLTLTASHQGGSILIEVRDDGRGLSRARLLAKARDKGIDAPDSLTDGDVWNLIFAPGFSTADVVTDVSGRGVGMDVVKRNITSLGGSVEIDSAEGFGMRVSVRLPLTMAIMDGMSIGVAGEVYIVPLSSVVESFQVRPGMVRTIGGSARVVEVRDEIMPVLDLESVFHIPRDAAAQSAPIMVVVESEGGRVGLIVDELLGQQQVVVKNLEANYRRVDDISGATILGDGRVALILDIASMVRRSRH
ncbi:MAG TPA: chemotaxis protein CheW [Burkholderiaceae bacterium]|jgi:two-component system chemotaxis sensor kinase CheA|nr:chemotaxis protein CheW [Burkholderiaceae bacterium]